jgi:subtilisin family serine protease
MTRPQLMPTMLAFGLLAASPALAAEVVTEDPVRAIVRTAPDVRIHEDREGGFWLVPDPARSRLTTADLIAARLLRDQLFEVRATDLRPLFAHPPVNEALARANRLDRYFIVEFPNAASAVTAIEAVGDFAAIGGPVEAIELDASGGVASPPDDPWFEFQYGMSNTGQNVAGDDGIVGADVNVLPAWDWTVGSEQVVVAVLDSGVDPHIEFGDRLLPGWNVPDGNDQFDDECGSHGTHVSGILGAAGENDEGIAGVAWRPRIMPVVVTNGCTGLESWVAEGIVWAVDHGADIINMSLQYSAGTEAFADAVAYADAAGVIQIAAAGNTGGADDVQAPARFPQTIAVAATDNRDRHEPFSSAGPEIDLAAPGWRIYSCIGSSSYGYKSGTSMAAPFVTGAVALMKTVAPDLDPVTAKVMLMVHAEDIESPGFDDLTGTGRLDIEASLLALDPQPPAAGDLNRDGLVDGEDFGIMLTGWGPCPSDCEETCVGDLNGDCRIDGLDLGLLFVDWTG